MGLPRKTMHSLIGTVHQGLTLVFEGKLCPINRIGARRRVLFFIPSINQLHSLGQSSRNILVQQCFPHIPSEHDVTFEDMNPTFKSVTGSLENQPEA
jgi:hypothetical protein